MPVYKHNRFNEAFLLPQECIQRTCLKKHHVVSDRAERKTEKCELAWRLEIWDFVVSIPKIKGIKKDGTARGQL